MSDTLAEFEQMVLVALHRRGGEAYGASLHEEILERTGRDVAIPAIYVTLGRLADKGLVEARREGGLTSRGGRGRKLFALTDEGRRAMVQTREFLDRLWSGVRVEAPGET